MNERIKELIEQATQYAHENATGDWEVGPNLVDIFNKKFAELIVKECGKIAFSEEDSYGNKIRFMILEHFGIDS